MSKIAVAGGNGGLGRMIVEALVAAKKDLVVLSRKSDSTNNEAPVIGVNYSDIQATTKTLEEHDVGTIISTLPLLYSNDHELNLIKAAEASKTTKRFIQSCWGVPYTEEIAHVFPQARLKLESIASLSKTSLEYTRVHCGYFLDYWGIPEVKSYLTPATVVLDLPANFAAIPGSGNTPVALTHTKDVAAATIKLLELPQWKIDTFIIGDKLSWNKIVEIVEKAKGSKVEVVYDSMEKLKTGQITELPSHVHVYPFFPKEQLQHVFATLGVWFDSGLFDLVPSRDGVDLNKAFSDGELLTAERLFQQKYGAAK